MFSVPEGRRFTGS